MGDENCVTSPKSVCIGGYRSMGPIRMGPGRTHYSSDNYYATLKTPL